MGRGILTGLIWGTIVGFGILTVANELVAPVQTTSERVASMPDAPEAMPETMSEAGENVPTEAPAATPDASMAPEAEGEREPGLPEAPQAPAQPAATAPELDVTAQMPAAEPDRSGSKSDVTDPEVAAEAMPEAETSAASAPAIEMPQGPTAPESGEGIGDVTVPESSPVLTPPQGLAPEAGASDVLPEAEQSLPKPAPLPDGATEAPEAPAMPDAGPGSEPESDAMTPAVEEQEAEDSTEETMPGQKVSSFTEREDSRVSSRLPSISSQSDADATAEDAAPTVVAEDLPALLAYSADFDQIPSGPVMSIILVDIAQLSPEDAVLTHLPFPVTFAVDALSNGAGDRAMSYREKGFEVLSMIALPQGATPQDAAVTLEQAEALVPVSIGFLDIPSASFQASRQVAAQVVATAAQSGRGLVSFPRGLNAMQQEAQRAKAPAALVFRDFDGRGQDVAAMKRFLDQAAFQAGTGKNVVLLGRSKPDTIQALAEWSLGNRAARVTMVPLSYLLSRSPL